MTGVADRSWTDWCACPWISYDGYEAMLMPEAFGEPYTALVNTKSSPLNIWASPEKKLSLLRVTKGDMVRVVDSCGTLGWMLVEKDGVRGYADVQYLLKVEDAGVDDDPNTGIGDDVPAGEHNTEDVLYRAKVVNVKSGLNLRTAPSKAENTILLMPKDAMVEVLGEVTQTLYNVRLEGISEDLLAKVLVLYPAAIVSEA